MSHLGPDLPEDIWKHIHSLMPLRDAARAACVSRPFLSSWRRYPNLTLTLHSLGYFDFTKKVNSILKNHSGVGIKKLILEFVKCYDCNDIINHLDSWLKITVTPQIEELTLICPEWFPDDPEWFPDDPEWFPDDKCSSMLRYKFPCSLLSNGRGNSIQYLDLECCAFQSTAHLGPLGSLTRLHLCHVCMTEDELGCFLSSSLVLERLELIDCYEIICLKIPGFLYHLSYLHVYGCGMLQDIENKAQNLRTIYFGEFPALYSLGVSLRLGELLHLNNIEMWCNDAACYARSELPSIAPSLETLTMGSLCEMTNAPTAPSKFLHLKYLCIHLGGVSPAYDYFLLASFFDASPSLETFRLNLPQELMEHDWISGGSSDLRQM